MWITPVIGKEKRLKLMCCHVDKSVDKSVDKLSPATPGREVGA